MEQEKKKIYNQVHDFPQTHLHVIKQPFLVAANPSSICMNQNAQNRTTEIYMRSNRFTTDGTQEHGKYKNICRSHSARPVPSPVHRYRPSSSRRR